MSRRLLDFVGRETHEVSISGFVRLELRESESIAWYWTYLVGVPGHGGVLVVRDHEVLPPRQGLEIRADGLWAELTCETPGEHWTFGLEAFGVRLDAAEDALRGGAEIGERIAVGLDIEWEVGAGGPPSGTVHGDVLVGRERFEIDGPGWFYDADVPDPVSPPGAGEAKGETIATVYVPQAGDDGRHLVRHLARAEDGLRWSWDGRSSDR